MSRCRLCCISCLPAILYLVHVPGCHISHCSCWLLQKRIEAELDQLQKDICRVGSSPGEPFVFFGELFDDEEAQQYYEALVGTLKCAKKRGIVAFKGQMLLKGMHDNVKISIINDGDKQTATEDSKMIKPKSQLSSVERTPPRGTDSGTQSLQDSVVDASSSESQTLPSVERDPPAGSPFRRNNSMGARHSISNSDIVVRQPIANLTELQSVSSVKRTPPRWGKGSLPPVRQTPPRHPTSFSRTPPRSDGKPSPSVSRFHARAKSLPFSPVRHTRDEHTSIEIPQVFCRERSHNEYTSDSEAELSNRRVKSPSKNSGASSDTESEVNSRRFAFQNRQLSLPSSFGDSATGGAAERVGFTPHKTAKSGSVSERLAKRSSVSRKKGNNKGDTIVERRPVAFKGSKVFPAKPLSLSGKGNFNALNKENQLGSHSKPSAALLARAKSEKIIRPTMSVRVDEEVEQLLRDICRVD